MNSNETKLVLANGKEFSLHRDAVASINPENCINCGTCREYCPVNAIEEKQKEICRLCPDCTDKPALTIQEIENLTNSACTLSCPLGISPQGYINLFKIGKVAEAFKLIWDKNPLPAVCGYVCHHPCEQDCKRGILVDKPLEIKNLKRYLGELFMDYQPEKYPLLNEEKIAIIGAGPAGLTAAHWLAKKGYQVTVYEQTGEAGGMLLRGIPEFRVDKTVVRKEIDRLKHAGITIITGCTVGLDPSIDELLDEYDRLIIAAGTGRSKKLKIEGWRKEQVLYALNLMEKVNSGQKVMLSGNVVVIGGGSVAVDTARTALRLGAEKVTIICLESGKQIPAHTWELNECKEEGIEIIEGVSPHKFTGHTSHLEGIEIMNVLNFNISEGNLSFDVDPATKRVIPADYAIVAVGQEKTKEWPQNEKIYFAGDIANSKCSVIDAMASGRKAALEIDNDLRKRSYTEYEIERKVSAGDRKYKIYPAVRKKLAFPEMTKLPVEERVTSFKLAECGFTTNEALQETFRCLECGYHSVNIEKCIGCGVCQKVCPKGDVIKMVSVNGEVK